MWKSNMQFAGCFHAFPYTDLQQMTFENILAKREIAHNEQILYLQQRVQLSSLIILTFTDILILQRCFQSGLPQIC